MCFNKLLLCSKSNIFYVDMPKYLSCGVWRRFQLGGEEKTVWLWTLLSLAITFITFALFNLVLSFDTLIGWIFKSFGFFFHGIPYKFTSTHRVVLWSWISKFCPENFSLCVVNTSNLINLTARRILIKLFYFYIIL